MRKKVIFFMSIIIIVCMISLKIDYKKNEINITTTEIEERTKYTVGKEEYIDDAAIMLPEIMYNEKFYRDDNQKFVYLTFDDGPSDLVTNNILDILAINDVKATFFILGRSIEENISSEEIIKRIHKDGHSIGNHGYCHDYSILYPNGSINLEAFLEDVRSNEHILKNILGENFNTRILRFPGGHYSWDISEEVDNKLEELGYYYLDWNVSNDDSIGLSKTNEELLKSVKETLEDKDVAIVLMHDTNAKETTATSLQSIIDHFKECGYKFRTIK